MTTDPKILDELERRLRDPVSAPSDSLQLLVANAADLIADSRRLAECEKTLGEVREKLRPLLNLAESGMTIAFIQPSNGQIMDSGIGPELAAECLKLLNQQNP